MGSFVLANAPIKKVYKMWYEQSISDFCDSAEGLELLSLCNAVSGVSASSLERYIVRSIEGIIRPTANSTTITSLGISSGSVTGTATARTFALTDRVTRELRVAFLTTSAVPGLTCGLRSGAVDVAFGSGTSGGFTWIGRWSADDASTVAGARQFCGLLSTVGAFTNVEPALITNGIGFGHGAADSNMRIYASGTGATTALDLGGSFPANTLAADLYEGALFSFKELNNKLGWQIKNLSTGAVSRGVITAATPGTHLPASSVPLASYQFFRTNNAAAVQAGIAVAGLYRGKPDE